MSIFINKKTRVLVQGVTGHHGSFNTQLMLKYGTNIVAGVTPGKKGEQVHGVPVYNSVKEALRKHRADWSIMFVPAPFARGAAFEALRSGLNLVVITEHIPVHDAIDIGKEARKRKRIVIGPNTPGLTTAGEIKLGIIPGQLMMKGSVGIVSRSGTLTHEIVDQLTKAGIGQSTVVGIGGDQVIGTDFVAVLKRFEKDKQTRVIVLIGEIGGTLEIEAAKYVESMKKPVVAFIAGRSAPPGKRMGHAGAIVHGDNETAVAKIRILKKAGVSVAATPRGVIKLVKDKL